MNQERIITGAAIAAQVPPVMVIVLMLLATGPGFHLFLIPVVYMVAMTIAAPPLVVFGTPTYFALRYLRWDTWWLITLLGSLFGALAWEILDLVVSPRHLTELTLDQYLGSRNERAIWFFAGTGGLTGLVFWCVAYIDLASEDGPSNPNSD